LWLDARHRIPPPTRCDKRLREGSWPTNQPVYNGYRRSSDVDHVSIGVRCRFWTARRRLINDGRSHRSGYRLLRRRKTAKLGYGDDAVAAVDSVGGPHPVPPIMTQSNSAFSGFERRARAPREKHLTSYLRVGVRDRSRGTGWGRGSRPIKAGRNRFAMNSLGSGGPLRGSPRWADWKSSRRWKKPRRPLQPPVQACIWRRAHLAGGRELMDPGRGDYHGEKMVFWIRQKGGSVHEAAAKGKPPPADPVGGGRPTNHAWAAGSVRKCDGGFLFNAGPRHGSFECRDSVRTPQIHWPAEKGRRTAHGFLEILGVRRPALCPI